MGFDLTLVAPQVQQMAHSLRQKISDKERNLQAATALSRALEPDLPHLKARTASAKTSWMVAGLETGLSLTHPSPALPTNYIALATDGSSIDVDRHLPVRCYLINIGKVALAYGDNPSASLSSTPQMSYAPSELTIANPDNPNETEDVQGPLVAIKRMIEECSALYELAAGQPSDKPLLAVLDGSLIMWSLVGQAYKDKKWVKDLLLDEGLLKCLNAFRSLSEKKPVALVSYISWPNNTDVVNVLRIGVCQQDTVNCVEQCAKRKASEKECLIFEGLQDRDLFDAMLVPGDRSEIFTSPSSISKIYTAENEIQYFYLKTEEEIGRVEFPRWMGGNRPLLDLAHATLIDQCRKGKGYPVVLSEAHEQAVINGSDRQQFNNLVQSYLSDHGLAFTTSAKSLSKRTRWM